MVTENIGQSHFIRDSGAGILIIMFKLPQPRYILVRPTATFVGDIEILEETIQHVHVKCMLMHIFASFCVNFLKFLITF